MKNGFLNSLRNTVKTRLDLGLRLGLAGSIAWGPIYSYGSSLSSLPRKGLAGSPSYIANFQGKRIVRLNENGQVFNFEISNGVIQEAYVEIKKRNHRVGVWYTLGNQHYRVTGILRTNQRAYLSSDLSAIYINPQCSLTSNDVDNIAKVLNSTAYTDAYLDSTCSSVSPILKLQLAGTQDFINPSSDNYKNLQKCLKDLYFAQSTLEGKAAIFGVQAGIVSLARGELVAPTKFTIGCGKEPVCKKPVQASTTVNPSKISFYYDNNNNLVTTGDISETFIHELVHYVEPSGMTQASAEKMAESISQMCTGKLPHGPINIASLKKQFLGVDTSKSQFAQLSKDVPVKVTNAANSIPPQKVDIASVDTVSTLAESSSPAQANAINNSAQAVFQEPMNQFARSADIIDAAIPQAQAETGGFDSSSSDSTLAGASPQSRMPSSELTLPSLSSQGSNSPFNNGKVVEEIVVPPADGSSNWTKATLTQPAQVKAQVADEAEPPAQVAPQTSRLPASQVGGNSGSGFTQALGAAATRSTPTSPGNGGPSPVLTVNGINFTAGNISGSAYSKYKSQINDPTFRSQLENSGILITKDGSLLTKPKKLNVSYIDNGTSLVYGDF